MILRVGFLVGASVAAFAVTHISTNSWRNRNNSTEIPKNDGDSRFQERNVEEKENGMFRESITVVDRKQEEEAEVKTRDRKGYEAFELEFLSNVAEEMEQRRMSQEIRLEELYGFKQQNLGFTHLQKQLKAKNVKIDMLNATKNALQVERKKLHEEINQSSIAKKELEIANERIKEIQATMNRDDEQVKRQLKILKEHLLSFHMKETSIRDKDVEKKVQAMKEDELEASVMQRKNRELQLEARELTIKLVAAQTRITSLSNMTEDKVKANVEGEITSLKHTNEDLLEQVERQQKKRFDIVEELVYQRWLNACLRFEIQDYLSPQQKTPKQNFNKKLSFDSQVKAKRLSLDTNFDSISSQTSSIESDEVCSTITSYSCNQESVPRKFSLIRSVKRWGKGRRSRSKEVASAKNESSPATRGLVRRFSTSDVPSNPSILRNKAKQDVTESPETPTPCRVRRVSFSESVKPEISTVLDAPKPCHVLDFETSKSAINTEKMETSPSTVNVVGANGLSKEDNKGESQMVNNAEIGRTEDLHPGMAVEELGEPHW